MTELAAEKGTGPWGRRWRDLVEARESQLPLRHGANYWDRRARGFAMSVSGQPDPLLEILQPWLQPRRTLIDVGAGTGRHAGPLSEVLDWVTAVEPSVGMRELIPRRDNLTVVGSSWMEAEVAPADLVISSHVLYGVTDPEAFLAKLEAAATERVFVYLRDGQLRQVAEFLFEELTGEARRPMPEFADLWNLLREMGIHADVVFTRYPSGERFENLEHAVEEARLRLGDAWDEDRGRRWLEADLRPEPDGTLYHDAGEMVSGVAHWKPRT